MKKTISIFMSIAIVLIGACTIHEPEIESSETEKVIDLQLSIPGIEIETRAIGATEESAVNSAYLLAFKVEGESETFDYAAIGTIGDIENGVQNISAKVEIKSYNQRFVVITNANSEVAAVVGTTNQGAAKATMLASLEVSLSGGWNAASTTNYDALPMWGESTPVTISSGTASISAIQMLRMVAKIDVQLDTENNNTDVTSVFRLKSVHLYNTNTKGRIVPNSTTAPTIPSFPPTQPILSRGPISYTDFDSPGVEDVAMIGAIYLFETEAPDDGADATCIVIGGEYGEDSNETYYRVDFLNDQGAFTHILRNHHYIINITKVSGKGYTTPDEAFLSKSINIESEILRLDEREMVNVVTDGQYVLSVNEYEFNFDASIVRTNSGNNLIKVRTDYVTTAEGATSGWYIEKIVDAATGAVPTWLTLSSQIGAANVLGSIRLSTNDSNTTDLYRIATIWIAAGKLRVAVKVIQRPSGVYVGRFGGELKRDGSGEWQFEYPVYVQGTDESDGMAWQSTSGSSGVVTSDYDGKSTTYDLRASTFPAANFCFEKNSDFSLITKVSDPNYIWYLPAQKQLMAIYVVHNSFPAANKFSAENEYWSATEINNSFSWPVGFDLGYTSFGLIKTASKRVRCIREYSLPI